ncbi:DUF6088 family protein [Flavitalea sp. BT771]|uniref:DUF6088 family protein n=1 Tax=Flavitalea sp. BT771 TaxID=3063329 RepID=UPI0026E3457F|nr:DUF6088 family protein [Flavitalea sp. BT771]MDO6430867.1 DUF6088 family protein [Flavitalea sp. BT771]MDV6218993.1 DUF6088 family protein [Flavitalea sp. BT771]
MATSASIASTVQRQVAALGDGQVLTIMMEGQTEVAYYKALSRMVKAGKLVRLEKGKYYKPRNSRFGTLRPSEMEIVKTFTQRGGKTVGYLTGNALYNQWRLTTQVPNKITIARCSRLPEREISGYKLKFVVRPFPFREADIPMLQLLDALTDIRQIPDTSPATVIPLLVAKMKELQPSQLNRLTRLALEYPPSTRALLGALLDTHFAEQKTGQLQASLNPLTRYQLAGIEALVSDKSKWYFK